jgi:hypothetical protein
MIILDKKDQYHSEIEQLMHARRFGGIVAHRVKWIVEFSYTVDSKKNLWYSCQISSFIASSALLRSKQDIGLAGQKTLKHSTLDVIQPSSLESRDRGLSSVEVETWIGLTGS